MFLLNKNVLHNGKSYPKGSEIKKGDDGFEALVKNGHAEEAKSVAHAEGGSSEQPEAGQSEEQPARPAKPGRSSR